MIGLTLLYGIDIGTKFWIGNCEVILLLISLVRTKAVRTLKVLCLRWELSADLFQNLALQEVQRHTPAIEDHIMEFFDV